MQINYNVYKIIEDYDMQICVPSEDYYARNNDWSTETITGHSKLSFVSCEITESDAETVISNLINDGNIYTILKTYQY